MENPRQVLVFASNDELADFMVKQWILLSGTSIREKGFFCAAVSGGETPVRFYNKLSAAGPEVQWDKIHLFLTDERFVRAEDPAGNYRLIHETLLKKIRLPEDNIHKVPLDGADLFSAASMYEQEIKRFFRLPAGGIPEFDLITLGIGADGHTASLFPGHTSAGKACLLACPVKLDKIRHDRITLTLPVINNARTAAFLVSGKAKAQVLHDVVEARDNRLPASLVSPGKGSLWFLADSEAAQYLPEGVYRRSNL